MGSAEVELPAVAADVAARRLGGWELVRRDGADWIVRLVGTDQTIESARRRVGAHAVARQGPL